MTDEELIKFLWKLLSDEVTDGDLLNENDFTIIKHEFENRGYIEPNGDIFEVYS